MMLSAYTYERPDMRPRSVAARCSSGWSSSTCRSFAVFAPIVSWPRAWASMRSPTSCSKKLVTVPLVPSRAARRSNGMAIGTIESQVVQRGRMAAVDGRQNRPGFDGGVCPAEGGQLESSAALQGTLGSSPVVPASSRLRTPAGPMAHINLYRFQKYNAGQSSRTEGSMTFPFLQRECGTSLKRSISSRIGCPGWKKSILRATPWGEVPCSAVWLPRHCRIGCASRSS